MTSLIFLICFSLWCTKLSENHLPSPVCMYILCRHLWITQNTSEHDNSHESNYLFEKRTVLKMFIEKLPSRTEDAISKSDRHQILNHFLAQIVIDSVKLFLFIERGQVVAKCCRGLGIFSERFLNDDAGPSRFCHGRLLQVGRHWDEDRRRQGQVEEPVGIGHARFALRDDWVQVFEIRFLSQVGQWLHPKLIFTKLFISCY